MCSFCAPWRARALALRFGRSHEHMSAWALAHRLHFKWCYCLVVCVLGALCVCLWLLWLISLNDKRWITVRFRFSSRAKLVTRACILMLLLLFGRIKSDQVRAKRDDVRRVVCFFVVFGLHFVGVSQRLLSRTTFNAISCASAHSLNCLASYLFSLWGFYSCCFGVFFFVFGCWLGLRFGFGFGVW